MMNRLMVVVLSMVACGELVPLDEQASVDPCKGVLDGTFHYYGVSPAGGNDEACPEMTLEALNAPVEGPEPSCTETASPNSTGDACDVKVNCDLGDAVFASEVTAYADGTFGEVLEARVNGLVCLYSLSGSW